MVEISRSGGIQGSAEKFPAITIHMSESSMSLPVWSSTVPTAANKVWSNLIVATPDSISFYILPVFLSSSINFRYGLVARICRSHRRVSSLLQRSAGKARVRFPVSETILLFFFASLWVRGWVGISFCQSNLFALTYGTLRRRGMYLNSL